MKVTETELEAWLELAELISDRDFVQRLNEMARATWEMVDPQHDEEQWSRELHCLYHAPTEAMESGEAPESARGQQLVEAYVQTYARAMGRLDEPGFLVDLLAMVERGTDPRAERYWDLIAVLKVWKDLPPIAAAHHWLADGLRWRAATDRRAAEDEAP